MMIKHKFKNKFFYELIYFFLCLEIKILMVNIYANHLNMVLMLYLCYFELL